MRFDLPFGTPTYRELVGKTCAVVDVSAAERVQAGDQLEDPRGHLWTVDHTNDAAGAVRLTLFSSAPAATLKENEEVRLSV